MNDTSTKVDLNISAIQNGDHICSIYQSEEQQFSQIIPFFTEGLMRHQKCVYVIDDNPKEEIISVFTKNGVEIHKYVDAHQCVLFTKEETYLKDGLFRPDAMISLIKETEKSALKEGFEGMRGTGEMTWMQDQSLNDKLIEYEAKLNETIPNSKSSTICQYNENKFSKELLIDVIRMHPYLIIYGKLYKNKYFYTPPQYIHEEKNIFPPSAYGTIIDTIREN